MGKSDSHEFHQIHILIVFKFIIVLHKVEALNELPLDDMSCTNQGLEGDEPD